MSNSVKKVPFLSKSLFKKVMEMNLSGNWVKLDCNYVYLIFTLFLTRVLKL